jgi:hypothetical protein
VVFYELFNEPTTYRNQLGPASWDTWKTSVEEQILLIRAYNPQAIPLVAGFDWAYDLTPLLLSPIAAEGIGYVTYPYAHKRTRPWEPKWEENFGFAANMHPILATEFGGFARPAAPGGQPPAAPADAAHSQAEAAYGPAIIKYLEGKGIGWTVWCFDPEWGPTLIENWDYKLSPSGEFTKAAMRDEIQ